MTTKPLNVFEEIADDAIKMDLDSVAADEMNRLLLRFVESPSLITYMGKVGNKGDTVELDFKQLPTEAVASVKSLIGPINIEVLAYNINGQPRTGFRFSIRDLVTANRPEVAALGA